LHFQGNQQLCHFLLLKKNKLKEVAVMLVFNKKNTGIDSQLFSKQITINGFYFFLKTKRGSLPDQNKMLAQGGSPSQLLLSQILFLL
jgi:hypothetical protein